MSPALIFWQVAAGRALCRKSRSAAKRFAIQTLAQSTRAAAFTSNEVLMDGTWVRVG